MKKLSALSFLLMLATVSVFGAKPQTIRLNLKQGDQFPANTAVNINALITVESENIPINMSFNTYMRNVVEGVNNDYFSIDIYTDRIFLTTDFLGEGIVFDTAEPGDTDSEKFRILETMLTAPVHTTMNRQGQTLSSELDQSVYDGLSEMNPQFSREIIDNIKQQISSLSSSEIMGLQGKTLYPDNPVSPGDTWNTNISTNISMGEADMTMTMDIESLYKGMEKGKRVILNQGIMTIELAVGGLADKIEIVGVLEGEFFLHKKKGFIEGGFMTMDIGGEINMNELMPDSEDDEKITIEAVITTTIN